ncbi:MAG: amino acid ABC transporter permease [Anaerolineales bacterium]
MQNTRETGTPSLSRPLDLKLSKLPWWVLILIAAGILGIFLIFSDANYYATFRFLLYGVATTLRITLIAFPISVIIGLFTGLARMSKNPIIYNAATIYVEVMRGIPIVVLLLMVAFAFVPISVEIINNVGGWGLHLFSSTFLVNVSASMAEFSIRSISMELRAIFALAIAYGAFEAEIFRGGICSIGKGQMEAARSLGMSYFQAMRFIILPQAVRIILPPLGNDFIALLKDSSLATVLAVSELTQLTRVRKASTFRVMETFNVAAFLYLSLTLMLSAAVKYLEKRMKIEGY